MRLWNADTGEPLVPDPQSVDPPHRLTVSPEGAMIITGGVDDTIRLWDPRTGQLRTTQCVFDRPSGGHRRCDVRPQRRACSPRAPAKGATKAASRYTTPHVQPHTPIMSADPACAPPRLYTRSRSAQMDTRSRRERRPGAVERRHRENIRTDPGRGPRGRSTVPPLRLAPTGIVLPPAAPTGRCSCGTPTPARSSVRR